MRDNRFTYLGNTEDDQLRKQLADRLGVSQSDAVRWSVRKTADELGLVLQSEAKSEGGQSEQRTAA